MGFGKAGDLCCEVTGVTLQNVATAVFITLHVISILNWPNDSRYIGLQFENSRPRSWANRLIDRSNMLHFLTALSFLSAGNYAETGFSPLSVSRCVAIFTTIYINLSFLLCHLTYCPFHIVQSGCVTFMFSKWPAFAFCKEMSLFCGSFVPSRLLKQYVFLLFAHCYAWQRLWSGLFVSDLVQLSFFVIAVTWFIKKNIFHCNNNEYNNKKKYHYNDIKYNY